jgi:hypothetical protein
MVTNVVFRVVNLATHEVVKPSAYEVKYTMGLTTTTTQERVMSLYFTMLWPCLSFLGFAWAWCIETVEHYRANRPFKRRQTLPYYAYNRPQLWPCRLNTKVPWPKPMDVRASNTVFNWANKSKPLSLARDTVAPNTLQIKQRHCTTL